MTPALFLFLIISFAETLEEEWETQGLNKAQFNRQSHSLRNTGQLIGYKQKNWTRRHISHVVILFTCSSYKRHPTLYDQSNRFGLEIHVGKENKQSKTECNFFPPRFFCTHKDLKNPEDTES